MWLKRATILFLRKRKMEKSVSRKGENDKKGCFKSAG